ncbi:glycerol-3-phosphate acyltransferase [Spirochaeta thermophila]|uniref:Glycerol-3-phosphate acyltransferase n=1 Tax=Winmispira thermophila (strain ATCC 49972 / DSM 6192 / RI 19.B1) TaxID=665571 RepID=E0RTQ3_WINT6|nr:glycerol-3-phosphate acyltransferase [Spirochaeta thermophila]ADN02428.1 hypothetical protein STHERM_c14880 [Spirochaeta thermophila DSM 6192]
MDLLYSGRIFLSLLTGYLLGSFLPAYFLSLGFRGTDIRTVGDGNPGVVNAARSMGLAYGIVTALYDVTKPLIALYAAYSLFRLPLPLAYLAGFCAILGHKYPFYLGFKGGRGIAATVGLFLFLFAMLLVTGVPPMESVAFFAFAGLYALIFLLATHGSGDLFAVTILPMTGLWLALHVEDLLSLAVVWVLLGMISYEAAKNLGRDGIALYPEKSTSWRVLARPLALVFIPIDLFVGRWLVYLLLGLVLGLFFVLDLLRLLLPVMEERLQMEIATDLKIFKKKEEGRISSITTFLFGILLCFLLFDRYVAYAAVGFVALGDMFGKIVGINFGRLVLFRRSSKTLEGTLGFLAAALGVGFFLWVSGALPLHVLVVGALSAAVVEALPGQVDDNFSVSVVSGVLMALALRFL